MDQPTLRSHPTVMQFHRRPHVKLLLLLLVLVLLDTWTTTAQVGAPAPPPPLPVATTAAPERVELSWLLRGRGQLSAATLHWGASGQALLRDVRFSHPARGLELVADRVDYDPLATLDGAAEPLRLTGVQGAFRLAAPEEAATPPTPAAPAPAPQAIPGSGWREGRPLVRLLGLLGRLAAPTSGDVLTLLPPLRIEQGRVELRFAHTRIVAEELHVVFRPGSILQLDARLVGPGSTRGRFRTQFAWPTRTDQGGLELHGRFELQDGSLNHPAVAASPLVGLATEAEFRLLHRPDQGQLELELHPLRVRGLAARAVLKLERLGRGPLGVRLQLDLPDQPCQRLADALPAPLIPRLSQLRLDGTLGGGLVLAADLRQLAEPLRTLELRGKPLLGRCRPLELGPELNVERLKTRFVQTIPPRRPELPPARVGPGTDHWVPLERLPRHVLRSMLLTEDMGFYRHGPLALGLIRKAINMNLRGQRYVYGGSTISQQLVKNLFFDGEKHLARKLQEAFVAWRMERLLTKDQILELYVNCIEYAPGIYGIGRAAPYYFDHDAEALTPVEGVFLATIKPMPSDGPRMARKGRADGWWIKRMAEVMQSLAQEGEITPEELAAAAPYQPTFRPDFAEHSRQLLRRR